MRAMYECLEAVGDGGTDVSAPVSMHLLRSARMWNPRELERAINAACRAGLMEAVSGDQHRLTAAGRDAATRVARNHRLWEMYLVTHADVAPSHVDRGADAIEHVLAPEMIQELERALRTAGRVPPSPHVLGSGAGMGDGEAAR